MIAGKGLCVASRNGGKAWQKEGFEPKMDYSWLMTLGNAWARVAGRLRGPRFDLSQAFGKCLEESRLLNSSG